MVAAWNSIYDILTVSFFLRKCTKEMAINMISHARHCHAALITLQFRHMLSSPSWANKMSPLTVVTVSVPDRMKCLNILMRTSVISY